ncbi:MAG: ribonuclease R [Bacteroidales bacterium]|nr:ribonuclease R [Bacteroidales bacterium]
MSEETRNKVERYNRRTLTRVLSDLFKNNPMRDYSRDEIIDTLGITDEGSRQVLDLVIEELLNTNRINKNSYGDYHAQIKTGVIIGTMDLSKKGAAFVTPDESDIEIAISNENLHNALHGDKVEVSLFARTSDGSQEGEVIRIIQRARTTFVGTIEKSKNFAFLVPNHRTMPYDIFIPLSKMMKAKPGDKAVARITEWPEGAKNPIGEIVEVLGATGDNETEMHAILAEFNLPYAFPKEVEEEAAALDSGITPEEIAKRRDMRDVLTFTIDPADAKDFDDAISYRVLPNGNYEIGVHIADVSHYIVEDTKLDQEAFARATSVYLVDRVVPMLPETLCNGICSLRQDEEKLTFSAVFELDENAEIQSEWFGKTVIKSNRRFCYDEAQQVIETKEGDCKEAILKAWDLASKLRDARFKAGSISFDKAEIKFDIDETGKPLRVYFKETKEANWLVEEFMLLANKRVATYIGSKKDKRHPAKTFVYRIHDEPDLEKLSSFQKFIGKFGYSINMSNEALIAKTLNEVLTKVKGRDEQEVVSSLAVRSMAKAIYSTENIGHYGLAFPYYTHFTSPIRRYPDLMVHRLLFAYLNGEKSANKAYYEKLCKHCSDREYLAVQAERASDKYKEVEFMRDHLGETFNAVISGITEWGVYAELEENKIEGMIPMRDLDDDFYMFDEENYCLIGHYTRKKYQLGDKIQIKIARANLERKQLDFVLATSDKHIETDPDKADAMDRRNGGGSSSRGGGKARKLGAPKGESKRSGEKSGKRSGKKSGGKRSGKKRK